jgi:Beta-eliminating lyase
MPSICAGKRAELTTVKPAPNRRHFQRADTAFTPWPKEQRMPRAVLACRRDLERGMGHAFSRRAHRSMPRLIISSCIGRRVHRAEHESGRDARAARPSADGSQAGGHRRMCCTGGDRLAPSLHSSTTGRARTDRIDLRPDTVAQPTAAMAAAPLGDDHYGEDPSTSRLQMRCAELLGKAPLLWLPTGTLANQVALRTLTRPGDEVVACRGSRVIHALCQRGLPLAAAQLPQRVGDGLPKAARGRSTSRQTSARPVA